MAQVRVYFSEGSGSGYAFPHVQAISDPKEGIKAVVIPGNRGDGSIIIRGGRKSQEITVRGIIIENDGYDDITSEMSTMKSDVTTNPATLSLQHWDGDGWVNDWSYSVIRIDEISFPDNLRFCDQEYELKFLVLGY